MSTFCYPVLNASMTTPIKSSIQKKCPPAPKKYSEKNMVISNHIQILLNDMDASASEAFRIIRLMSDILKERAAPDEITAAAIVWLTRLSWAIEDFHEYKTRQLIANCDQSIIDSIHIFINLLHKLISLGISMINERFRENYFISRTIVSDVCSFGSCIKDTIHTL